MEAASLGLGAVGLALQLHELVLGCLEALRNFRDADEKNALLNCKLQVEQCILARWGQRCGLHEGRLSRQIPHQESQGMVVMILQNMLQLVSEAEALRKKYGMKYIASDELDTASSGQKVFAALLSFPKRKEPPPRLSGSLPGIALSRLNIAADDSATTVSLDDGEAHRKWIEKGKTSMSFMKKYRWVVADSRRFEELIRHLQDFNKSLYRLTQESAPALVMEGDILDATPDRYLGIVEQATSGLYPNVSLVMNIRRSVAHLEPAGPPDPSLESIGPYRNLRIDVEQLQSFRPSPASSKQNRAIATYRPRHGRSRPVLVEWRHFESGLGGLTQHTREATIGRAENLARILQRKPSPASAAYFRLLDCVGFYITDRDVGYVFDLPPGANASQPPQSLEELLCEEESDGPPLEQRLALCKALCNSVYWLHASELVHKGLRSSNVLFFEREDEGNISLAEPYVIGFDHSRPDGPDDPTLTITAISEDEDRYRHPAARVSVSRRSTKIHDMYSLGLVLLEIGHWIKLKDLVENRVGEEVRNYLVSEDSPVHGMSYMVGSRLRRVVDRCVQCDFNIDIDDPSFSAVLRGIFLHEISSEVMKCSV